MRVIVFGATGTVGAATVSSLVADKRVDAVVGVARRVPAPGTLGAQWRPADISRDDLAPLLEGADAVVHLAWSFGPARDEARQHAVNVIGSERVFAAVAAAPVQTLVYASATAAYSPAGGHPVDETYPTDGIWTSSFSRQKAYVERLLDRFELRHEVMRVVRLRPAPTWGRAGYSWQPAASVTGWLPRPTGRRIALQPDVDGRTVQAVHAADVAEAYRLAVTGSYTGPFNIATDPVSGAELARAGQALRVPIPASTAQWPGVPPTPCAW